MPSAGKKNAPLVNSAAEGDKKNVPASDGAVDDNKSLTAFISKVFDKAKEVKTPLQLISFGLAVVLAIALLKADVGANALVLLIILFPFILIIILLSKKTLDAIRHAGNVVGIIVAGLVLCSLVFSAYIAAALIRSSQAGLVATPDNPILTPARKQRVEDIRDNEFKIKSYQDNYNVLSSYYRETVLDCFSNDNVDSYQTVALLRGEMDSVTSKIVTLKESNVKNVYGDKEIAKEVKKLQETILILDFTKYLWQVVEKTYGSRGEIFTIDEIVDTNGWNIPQDQLAGLRRVRFSRVEADFIKALGRDVIIKPIDGFTASDVDSIRRALSSLGYASNRADGVSNEEILRRYKASIRQYFRDPELTQPFYALAEKGMSDQIAIYLAFSDTGLIDIKRFLIKNSPDKAKSVMSDLLSRRLELFNLNDLDRLTELMIKDQGQDGGGQSAQVIFKMRDRIKNKLGDSPETQEILASDSVETYFTLSLKRMLLSNKYPKTVDSDDADLFLNANLDEFSDSETANVCIYGRMLQDFLSYYNVLETNVVIGSIEA